MIESDFPFRFSIPSISKSEIMSAGEAEGRLLLRVNKATCDLERTIWRLVQFYKMTSSSDKAVSWLKRLFNLTQDNDKRAACHLTLGQLMERKNDFQAAIDHYADAIALDPFSTHTAYFSHNNLGYSLNQLGSCVKAEPYCRKAIEIDSTKHNAYKNLGVSLEGQGKYVEAARNYFIAIQKEASDPRALRHLEALYPEHPEIADSIPDFEKKLQPSREAVSFADQVIMRRVKEGIGDPPESMTHAMEIAMAVHSLVFRKGLKEFTRDQVRRGLGLTRERWMSAYTAIFQAMRADHPGGAPTIKKEYQGSFKRVRHGTFVLAPYGEDFVRSKPWQNVLMG
jgi:tetratricopeptide (TPR) repeat protein